MMSSRSALLLVVIGLADSVAFAAPAVQTELAERISKIVQKYYPDAKISQDNDVFLAKYDTMVFTVHRRLKTGEYLKKADQVEGPNVKGFILGLALKEGKYEGPALLPSTSEGPYWSTYWDYPPTADREKMFSIHFSYGDLINQEFKRDILEALPRTKRPAIKQ